MNESSIQIYRLDNGATEIEVKLDQDTIWLSQKQIAELFDKDSDTIGLHLKNIYSTGELEEFSTTEDYSVVQKEGTRNIRRRIKHYNLDAIISVGYRVNSIRGTQFRIWANKILKEYLIQGYSINERALKRQNEQLSVLQKTIKILSSAIQSKELTSDESKGLLSIVSDYSYALDILDQYDYQTLTITKTSGKDIYRITYAEAIDQINLVRKAYGNSELFGREKDKSFKSSISTIYQTFDGKDLYPSIEEKAAHLLYFITKNHSFSDGNKRIAAFMFLYFLSKNGILYDSYGNKRIADNTLVALTLMIAVSKQEEMDVMIKVIVNLINTRN
jgi:prophage maintenance system killer protein